ncbi:hydantoinase/oxoprolinase family protein [Erwiniaceae bacterium BAC15a-03b]|uniref:Hydantoinase/oxoprolinase family protein n=1 Tax=Winslowiella arboricola TaxID=2978220 RepID=A0A9J6PQJ0_9GAMM|nr:hydantoinase/oxoprolinase family protein [Winslowiella arboricola]MCU5774451.1 hydantoinase/oxoprolinase family protein [Winslowiella arboricola]MCU5778998.1 hydantoinase/oxoprolinase family protein [Winslowiella arboricola]
MNNIAETGVTVGVDVGGTFTDFVLFDPQRQRYFFHKQPSTPQDPALAVSDGLLTLLAKSQLAASALSLLLHGTTLGLNAIIQRRGANIALVISEGFRDVLEIARARMPSSFDFHADREPPFLPRQRVLEVAARFSPAGSVVQWPDETALTRLAAEITALDISAVALVTINGYSNPDREAELATLISDQLTDIPVLSSAQLWPEIREYERTLVAGLNAYIQPLMQHYFSRLNSLLEQQAISAPLLITASNGGVLPLASARQRPVDTLLSGPASGVIAAAHLASSRGSGGYVSFDMGGTSSDISLSADGEVERVNRTDIGGLPLILPVVGVSAIGAGGGSIIHVDEYGILKVGPESAGADPGPVAYNRGGSAPTITDCYLVSGILPADALLAGTIPLDIKAARAALNGLAQQLGITGNDAAEQVASGALAVATTQMATELNKALAQRGVTADSLTLIPFGGAGPTHANLFASEAGIDRILVPLRPGTFCAQGAITADIRRDFVRSLRVTVNAASFGRITYTVDELNHLAQQWFRQQAAALSSAARTRVEADMRYSGQAYELSVTLESAEEISLANLLSRFQQLHQQRYGFSNADAAVELTTLRLSLTAVLPRPEEKPFTPDRATAHRQRPLYIDQRWQQADVWQRASIQFEDRLNGPAIVEQDDTTTLILPGWQARLDSAGNLLISRQPQEETL